MKKYIAMPILTLIFAIVLLAIPTYAAGSNANLSTLGIKPNDFTGFKENKTEYEATVPNTTKEVEVYAKAKDSKAKITGTGKLKLQEGQNTAKVVVNAQDGTQKTYTINIKRLKSGEKVDTQKTKTSTQNSTKASTTSETKLQSLTVEGCELEPAFSKDTYQYKANFSGEQTKLNISANAENADVQIIGNEELEDGENIITILVSDESEENSTTYQITASKNVVTQQGFTDFLKDENVKLALKIAGIIVGVIIILIILIIIIKKIKNRHKDMYEEYEEENNNNEFEELVEELNKKEEKRKKNARNNKENRENRDNRDNRQSKENRESRERKDSKKGGKHSK